MFDELSRPPSLAYAFTLALVTCVSYALHRSSGEQIWRETWLGGAIICVAASAYLWWLHGAHYAGDIIMRWRWPQIRTLELISRLTPEQLSLARSANLVQGKIRIESGRIIWHYETPYGNIDPAWLVNYFNSGRAFSKYPEFPSLRNFDEGTIAYQNESAFNHWMCDQNLAEKRIGQPFLWKVPKAVVLQTLGLVDAADDKLPARPPDRLKWPTNRQENEK